MTLRVDFDALPWQSPAHGVRFKAFTRKGQRLRLLEFSNGFTEPSWCLAGHAFHVLEGSLTIETEKGQRHKASVSGTERALLLLFEVG